MEITFKFLIATSKKLILYENGKLTTLQDSKGVYFGTTKLDNFGYCFLARNNFDGSGGGLTNSINSFEFFDLKFEYLYSISLQGLVKDGHQIYCKDDIIYITNTGVNCITTVQKSGEVNHIQLYNEIGEDIHHINSINYYNGYWYINQHRKTRGLDDGGVAIFDNNWKYVDFIDIGKHCHDVIFQDNCLWSSDSDVGEIIKVNLSNKEKLTYLIDSALMTRGLAINNDYLLVGLSEYDKREMRHKSKTARVKIYKHFNMEHVVTIEIEGVGQLNNLLLC